MNNKTGFAITAIAVVAALLVTTSAMSTNNAFAGGHQYKKTTSQALAQTNTCGNGPLAIHVDCQNAASQIQGKDNAARLILSQDGFGNNDHGNNDHGGDNGRGDNGGDNGRGDNGGDNGRGGMMSIG